MISIKGTGVSAGIAEGTVFCYKRASASAVTKRADDRKQSLNAGKMLPTRQPHSLMLLLKKHAPR